MLHKVMLLTKKLEKAPKGGRELLCKVNHDSLRTIYGDRFVLYELQPGKVSGIFAHIHTFLGHIDGLNDKTCTEALRVIRRDKIDRVFVDGSNLGGFVALLKRQVPEVEVTTFFHNVEARFFWGALCVRKTPRAAAVLIANYLAERKTVRLSDKLICLSERDSRLLKKLYGRGATHISPMALEDKCPPSFLLDPAQPPEKFALFVGGTFYANQAGITWFVREVAPHSAIPIFIVGRGFEALRSELEIPGKVRVIGAVDSLADWYHRAQFVIAPIFDGSGMKTKVAEALMYGKKIVGTPEAFSGYEGIAEQAGWVCHDVEGFLRAINEANATIIQSFDAGSRALYMQNYSLDSATARMNAILEAKTC